MYCIIIGVVVGTAFGAIADNLEKEKQDEEDKKKKEEEDKKKKEGDKKEKDEKKE